VKCWEVEYDGPAEPPEVRCAANSKPAGLGEMSPTRNSAEGGAFSPTCSPSPPMRRIVTIGEGQTICRIRGGPHTWCGMRAQPVFEKYEGLNYTGASKITAMTAGRYPAPISWGGPRHSGALSTGNTRASWRFSPARRTCSRPISLRRQRKRSRSARLSQALGFRGT